MDSTLNKNKRRKEKKQMSFEFFQDEAGYQAPEMTSEKLRDFRQKLGRTALFLAK